MKISNMDDKNKFFKHAVNTGMVVAGTAVVASNAKSVARKFDIANSAKYGAANVKFEGNLKKIHESVSKFAQKIFPKGGKVSNAIDHYTGAYLTGGVERMRSLMKGKLAIFGVAATTILALVTLGAYNAGKINGKS